MTKKITYEQHVRKHTKKENTYDPDCQYCNPESVAGSIEERLRKMRYGS